MEFAEPRALWLLAAPGVLLVLWIRLVLVRRRDARALAATRRVPVPERFPLLGPALFPLCAILAIALLVVALARPQVVTAFVRTAGVDLVVLLDGSASMHVSDVAGNRWQRSVAFLRALGDALSWERDRVALTLFARIAAPQVRLTSDPNTLFFFLDHLDEGPPFRLEDDTTWDTNIALGIEWGLRVIDKDEELRGASANAQGFILMSDGQAWSGDVENAIGLVRGRGIPVHVVGVGTQGGGIIPDPLRTPLTPVVRSRLDRESLMNIATRGGGRYLELDRGPDADVANQIIDDVRRRAGPASVEPRTEDIYWRFLAASGVLALLGLLFLRERTELAIQLAGGTAALAVLFTLF